MTDTFSISVDRLKIARHFVGKDEARFYLRGVVIDPCEAGGAYLVATDARLMAILYDADAIAPRRATIIAKGKLGFGKLTFSLDAEHVVGETSNRAVLVSEITGDPKVVGFNWRRPLDGAGAKGQTGIIDAWYLAKIQKAVGLARIEIAASGPKNPHIVTLQAVPDALFVVMPCKPAKETHRIPDAILSLLPAQPKPSGEAA